MSYPISVVVPTKNRYKYLKKLIELIISFDTDEIELVIQDNSDNNQEILIFLNNINYPWLKYYYCSERLTSIENFDLAINHTTGDYVCFIGDDDGVVRNIVECAKWMKANNIEALRPATSTYEWPECGRNGYLTIEYNSEKVQYLNPIKELIKILKRGCDKLENIPVTYTGIVQHRVLEKIYNDIGTYFPGGASADIANGVALCFYVKRYVKLNIPIVITGNSSKTGGVSNRRSFIPFSELSFISPTVGENWEGDLPKYWFGVFVWPESAVKSLRVLGKEDFIQHLNYDILFAYAILRSHCQLSEYSCFCSRNKLILLIPYAWFRIYMEKIIRRTYWLYLSIRKGLKCWGRGFDTIVDAENEFYKFNIDFKKLQYK